MFSTIFDLASRFGVIDSMTNALISKPDIAAGKLAAVLDELVRTVTALDDELVRFLGLHFDASQPISRERTVLLGMEVGQSTVRINEARGHCHKIRNIYEAHLDKWFDRVFSANSAERNSLRTIFEGLGTADDYMIAAMREVSGWLELEAEAVLDRVDIGDLAGANQLIHSARLTVKPARKALVETAAMLRQHQADFIAASGTD